MTRSVRLLFVVLLAGSGLAVSVTLVRVEDRAPAATAPASAEPVSRGPFTDTPALAVLRAWDARRAAAYAAGSVPALADLYLPGSRAGAADVRLLRGYLTRGYRVLGLRMQVLALRVTERDSRRLRVEVTDRVAGAVAAGRGERVPLPRDNATTRTVTLVRGPDGPWRVSAVR